MQFPVVQRFLQSIFKLTGSRKVIEVLNRLSHYIKKIETELIHSLPIFKMG